MSRMKWKAVAIEELRNFEAVKISLETLPELINRQESAIYRIKTSDPSKVSIGGGDSGNDALLSAMVYRDELKNQLSENEKTVAVMSRILQLLTREEFVILDAMFINPRKNAVDSLCEELCIEKTAVYERRNKALERFTAYLYGWH